MGNGYQIVSAALNAEVQDPATSPVKHKAERIYKRISLYLW